MNVPASNGGKEDLEGHEEVGVGCQHSQTDMSAFVTPFSTQESLTCHKRNAT